MASLRATLSCIGRDTSGSNSVLRDLFGFTRRRVPNDESGSDEQVSMLRTMRGLQGRHVHLNVIAVGWWNEFNSTDSANARRKTDFAIMRTRQIFDAVNLGVGRVQYWVIDQSEANGAHIIGSEGEADELSDDWSVRNNGIDCFVPRSITDPDFIGISPVDGADSKGGKRDGLIAGAIDRSNRTTGDMINDDFDEFARTFAHEIGHYLGRSHNHDDGECPAGAGRRNLMAQTGCIRPNDARDAVELTSGQGSDMRDHGYVQSGC